MQTVVYYVRNDSLWRVLGSNTPEELVEGVQALQIVYGEDTDADRIVNNYVAANAVTNWANIVSVSVSLLVRSEQSGNDVDARDVQPARHERRSLQRSPPTDAVHHHRGVAQRRHLNSSE